MEIKKEFKMLILISIIYLFIILSFFRYQYFPFEGDNTQIIRANRITGGIEIINVDFRE